MPQDRTESRSDQGPSWLGLSLLGIVIALFLGVFGLLQRYGDELDPCVNEASVPCPPPASGRWFIVAAIIGVPAVVGLVFTISKRFKR